MDIAAKKRQGSRGLYRNGGLECPLAPPLGEEVARFFCTLVRSAGAQAGAFRF